MLLYLHHVPGRLRVKTASLRGNARLGALACGRLAGIEGVLEAAANPVTGSVIVRYEAAQVGLEHLWAVLCAIGVTRGPLPALDRHELRVAAPAGPAHAWTRRLGDAVAERLLERSLMALIGALI